MASLALGDPIHYYVRCGAIFVVNYFFYFFVLNVPMPNEIFERCVWFGLVFDIGCLVELNFGLVRGADRALARWEALHVMREA